MMSRHGRAGATMVIAFEDARRRVLHAVEAMDRRSVPLADAPGSVLARDVVTRVDLPPFDSSAMDGYAVRSCDIDAPPVTLSVVAVSSAGHPSERSIGPGEAARILTGAMVVDGADCVVRVEDTDGGKERVEVRSRSAIGSNIRRAGEGLVRGDVVIASGTVLNAAHLAVAASVGLDVVDVIARPRVAVVVTGDELVASGSGDLGPGQIYESNSIVLSTLVRRMGCAVTARRCGDDAVALRTLLVELAATHELILTSGGVSMGGEYDTMRAAVSGFGVDFWTMAVKPAKPMAFGHVEASVLFGLPGNPVAAVVAFEAFVRPAIRTMLGVEPAVAPSVHGVAGARLGSAASTTEFLRVRRDATGHWVSTGSSGPHLIGGLADAEALAVVGAGVAEVLAGEPLELVPLWL